MRVYKIGYREYEWHFSGAQNSSDWALTLIIRVKHVMASNALDAVDLLREDQRHKRIEIESIEHVCKVDIKK